MRRLPLAVALTAFLALPSVAGAAITASSIDDPGAPFLDFAIGTNQTFTAHVTGATSGDTVDLSVECGGAAFVATNGNPGPGYPVDSGGVVHFKLDDFDYYYCPFRVVPHGATAPFGSQFEPRLLGILGFDETTGAPGATDWEQIMSGPKGYADAESLGSCAIWSTYTIRSDYDFRFLFGCGGLFTADPTDTSHSSVRIGGVDAYLPATDRAITSGQPVITNLTHSVDATTGEASVSDSEGVVTCSGSDCTPSGVHVDHALHSDHGQQLVTLVDTWHNDGAAPVDLDLRYAFRVNTGSEVEGPSGFVPITDGTLPAPTGPGFVRARADSSNPDGDPDGARGALVYSAAPAAVSLLSDVDSDPGPQPAVVLRFTRSVAPGGTFRLTYGVATTIAQADADAAANDLLATTKPAVGITGPADGSTTTAQTATVTGTSSDDGGPPSVNVNGVAATVAGDGTWTASVPLAIGANTITATATDADGNTVTASRSVTRTQPPSPFKATLKSVKVKQGKDGTLTVTVTVNAAGKLSGSLSRKAGRKTKVFARGKKSAARGGTVKLKLKPSKATRKLLRKRSLKSTLKLSFTAQGSTAKTTKKVKLKRLKR